MEITAFDRASAQDIVLDPFPHLVIPNALPNALYQELLTCRPDPFTNFAAPPNLRLPIAAHLLMTMDHIPPLWKELARALTAPAICRRVATLFADHLHPDQPLNLLAENPTQERAWGLVHRDSPMDQPLSAVGHPRQPTGRIFTEARLEVVSPSAQTDGGSHRRAHLDSRNRLFTALLYLRPDDDDSQGGGLDLFGWRHKPTLEQMEAFQLDETMVERRATLPYHGNTIALFPQSPVALHGMAPRGPATHQRAYIFISAEMTDPWFDDQSLSQTGAAARDDAFA
jgi:hypothetical protein